MFIFSCFHKIENKIMFYFQSFDFPPIFDGIQFLMTLLFIFIFLANILKVNGSKLPRLAWSSLQLFTCNDLTVDIIGEICGALTTSVTTFFVHPKISRNQASILVRAFWKQVIKAFSCRRAWNNIQIKFHKPRSTSKSVPFLFQKYSTKWLGQEGAG